MGDSEDDRKAAHEVGCHFVGVMLGEENRFKQPPEHPITDLYQLAKDRDNPSRKRSRRLNKTLIKSMGRSLDRK